MIESYDSLLVVSFGGPERREDVLPFLQNVVRGRNVPPTRLLQVAEHYYQLGGASPINAQNRALIAALDAELDARGRRLPIYLGNRNWHPFLADTLRQMANEGSRRALALFTSAFSSYSSCRQYRENIAAARESVGPRAPEVHKLRAYFNHPGFIEATIARVGDALERLAKPRRAAARLVFTAHSIPSAMATASAYAQQLAEASELVAAGLGVQEWNLVYQSRSGPPSQPWLEPDVCDYMRVLRQEGSRDVVVVPIGFISDHVEVVYDLDIELARVCREQGIHLVRAATVGTHPRFVRMIAELIQERVEQWPHRPALGRLGPSPDECPADCCLAREGGARRP